MFHLLSYFFTQAAATTLQTMTMVADGAIAQGTVGYRFTENYRLLAAKALAANLTAVEFSSPTLNALSKWAVYPFDLSATIPGNPNIDDYRQFAPSLPTYEDVSALVSNSLVGAQTSILHAWIGTQQWTPDMSIIQQMASGNDPYIGRRMTMFVNPTLNKGAFGWGADANVVFEQLPRGGVYAVIGGNVVAANCTAWRINFPRMPLYHGRKLFPGDICSNALGDVPNWRMRPWMGVWGCFHTWEPFFMSLFGAAAGTVQITGFLDLVYLGGNQDPNSALNNALTVLGNAA